MVNGETGPMEIRRVDEHEAAEAYRVTATALLLPSLSADALGRRVAAWNAGRSWGALDGGRLVGHARALDLETTVPGGSRVPTAGVTSVGVLASHTRRGLLRAMMTALLEESAARGAVLASLRASEAAIYGRFGFGLAGLTADLEVQAGAVLHPVVAAAAPARGEDHTVRYLERGTLRTAVPAIHERVGVSRVGAVGRLDHWWDNLYDELDDTARPFQRWVVVCEDAAGTVDGYADFELDTSKPTEFANQRVVVNDLFAANPSAYRALWQFLLGLDLIGTVIARQRPIDEPLRWLLADVRGVRTSAVRDEQWVRLVDVEAAFAARTYAPVGASVVLAISDVLLPANSGNYRIGPERAVRTEHEADLRMDVAEAAALYLGGVRAVDLVAAGRVEQRTAGAAALADALLPVHPAPWCGTFY